MEEILHPVDKHPVIYEGFNYIYIPLAGFLPQISKKHYTKTIPSNPTAKKMDPKKRGIVFSIVLFNRSNRRRAPGDTSALQPKSQIRTCEADFMRSPNFRTVSEFSGERSVKIAKFDNLYRSII